MTQSAVPVRSFLLLLCPTCDTCASIHWFFCYRARGWSARTIRGLETLSNRVSFPVGNGRRCFLLVLRSRNGLDPTQGKIRAKKIENEWVVVTLEFHELGIVIDLAPDFRIDH